MPTKLAKTGTLDPAECGGAAGSRDLRWKRRHVQPLGKEISQYLVGLNMHPELEPASRSQYTSQRASYHTYGACVQAGGRQGHGGKSQQMSWPPDNME